jgi:hypothetical protein
MALIHPINPAKGGWYDSTKYDPKPRTLKTRAKNAHHFAMKKENDYG